MEVSEPNSAKLPDLEIVRFLPHGKGEPVTSVLELAFDSDDKMDTDTLRGIAIEGLDVDINGKSLGRRPIGAQAGRTYGG